MMRYEARDYGEVWCINQELRSASGDLTNTGSPGELVEIFCKKFQPSRSTRISIPWLFYNVHWMERMGYYQYFPAGAGWVQYSTMQTALSDYKSRGAHDKKHEQSSFIGNKCTEIAISRVWSEGEIYIDTAQLWARPISIWRPTECLSCLTPAEDKTPQYGHSCVSEV